MPRPRLSDSEKKLRGTYYRSNSEQNLVHDRVRIVAALPPPSGLTAPERAQWKLHMVACVQAGTLAHSNLLAFKAMVQVAATRDEALRQANVEKLVVRDNKGSVKANPVWKAAIAADARYQTWCREFGLTPATARNMPRLPAPKAELKLVQGAG